jgi:hypothetical protein
MQVFFWNIRRKFWNCRTLRLAGSFRYFRRRRSIATGQWSLAPVPSSGLKRRGETRLTLSVWTCSSGAVKTVRKLPNRRTMSRLPGHFQAENDWSRSGQGRYQPCGGKKLDPGARHPLFTSSGTTSAGRRVADSLLIVVTAIKVRVAGDHHHARQRKRSQFLNQLIGHKSPAWVR